MGEKELKFETDKVKEEVEKLIDCITKEELKSSDVDLLGKLIDIHKDLSNEKYWKIKEEVYNMRYNDYDNEYGRRGRYRGDYGRRGVRGTGRYRGEDNMEEMMEHYDNYMGASEDYNRGNYGAENEMLKSVEGIMRNICEIVEEIAQVDDPEVMKIIKKHARKISEME